MSAEQGGALKDTTVESSDSTATSKSTGVHYAVDLFHAFNKVCQRAKNGAQTCHLVASVVQERAQLEGVYAKELKKLAQSAPAEDWAEQFSSCWEQIQKMLETIAHEHNQVATSMQKTMAPGAKAFAAQQEIQVQRLTSEGAKVRATQQQMIQSLEKAQERYERKCHEAVEATAMVRREEGNVNGSPQYPGEERSGGAGQLLSKMWDSTSSFGRSPLERQRSKLDVCLDEVIHPEKAYVVAVEQMNAQRPVFEREIKENLHAFQLTEEQRIEYLKDLLLRQHQVPVKSMRKMQAVVENVQMSLIDVDEIADIEKGFLQLTQDEEQLYDESDLLNNPHYQRIMHIQSMSDKGLHCLSVIASVVSGLIAIEDHYIGTLKKVMAMMEVATMQSEIGQTSAFQSVMIDEGKTMVAAWKSATIHIQRSIDIHQEFRSLLSEPVSLSLTMMKQEYESSRASTTESFLKAHAIIGQESASHRKLQRKLKEKTEEMNQLYSSLLGNQSTDEKVKDMETVLSTLNTLTESTLLNDRDKKYETKLRQLVDGVEKLKELVNQSGASLQQKYQEYIQEAKAFLSVYMKNEKYRLQVEKSSLLSFLKALQHLIEGNVRVGQQVIQVLEDVNSVSDVEDFVRMNKRPLTMTRRITPIQHNNELLNEALKEYYKIRSASQSVASPNERKRKKVKENSFSETAGFDESAATRVKREQPCSETHESSTATESSPAIAQAANDMLGVAPDDPKEIQPLAISDFQKKFKLDCPEQVVESYSCALYVHNFPCHGRLYLTKDHMCFNGWRDTIYVASYLDITLVEKKYTALIVPNAIEITVHGEKAFFASFLFRDECYNSILQLQAIKRGTVEIMTSKSEDKPTVDVTGVITTEDQPSPDHATSPAITPLAECKGDSSDKVEKQLQVPPNDEILEDFDIALQEIVDFSVDYAHNCLWIGSDEFYLSLLRSSGETNVSVSKWDTKEVTYTAIQKSDTFQGSRQVNYTHNKKYMVGPSAIPTSQVQRYRWAPSSRLVVSVTSTVSDVPYCDYFRAESRWVFTTTGHPNSCCVQVGIKLHWLKSTWLKKQIEGTSASEAKESARAWLKAAISAAKANSTEHSKSKPQRAVAQSPASLERNSKENAIKEMANVSSSPQAPIQTFDDTKHAAQSAQLDSFNQVLRLLNVLCILLFLVMMYRVSIIMQQMQILTHEVMVQNREQQELLRQMIDRLHRE